MNTATPCAIRMSNFAEQRYRVTSGRKTSDTSRKIQSFMDLPVGWHYGEGQPCAPSIRDAALQTHAFLLGLGFAETDAFPGIDGGLLLTIYHAAHYFELRFENDGTITYRHEIDDIEIDEQEALGLQQVQTLLLAYRQEPWTQYASSISTITIPANIDSPPRPLHLIATGSPSSMPRVLVG